MDETQSRNVETGSLIHRGQWGVLDTETAAAECVSGYGYCDTETAYLSVRAKLVVRTEPFHMVRKMKVNDAPQRSFPFGAYRQGRGTNRDIVSP